MSVRNRNQPQLGASTQPLPARNFFGNRFVYGVVSQRAGGVSVGINMNPDGLCDFACVYCEVDRCVRSGASRVHVPAMLGELENVLRGIHEGDLGTRGWDAALFDTLPFREVALSGDGEPTLCPNFREITEAVVNLRARRIVPFFKIVLITNTTGFGLPGVQAGIDLLAPQDEIWAKLDAGTQEYMDEINRGEANLERVLENILALGRRRPVIIQSLFPLVHGVEPSGREILAYAQRLRELREAGAQISLVQIYSAHRPAMDSACAHLPLRALSRIARVVREESGLNAEVF